MKFFPLKIQTFFLNNQNTLKHLDSLSYLSEAWGVSILKKKMETLKICIPSLYFTYLKILQAFF